MLIWDLYEVIFVLFVRHFHTHLIWKAAALRVFVVCLGVWGVFCLFSMVAGFFARPTEHGISPEASTSPVEQQLPAIHMIYLSKQPPKESADSGVS